MLCSICKKLKVSRCTFVRVGVPVCNICYRKLNNMREPRQHNIVVELTKTNLQERSISEDTNWVSINKPFKLTC